MTKQKGNFWTLLACIVICQLPGLASIELIAPSIQNWYLYLIKPELTPPAILFGPVWILLYLLMGFSLYSIITENKFNKKVKIALLAFSTQWILNAAWSPIFFYLQNIQAGLLIILALELSIISTICLFWKINKKAAYLLLPYLAWVTFATYLNYSIWILNP